MHRVQTYLVALRTMCTGCAFSAGRPAALAHQDCHQQQRVGGKAQAHLHDTTASQQTCLVALCTRMHRGWFSKPAKSACTPQKPARIQHDCTLHVDATGLTAHSYTYISLCCCVMSQARNAALRREKELMARHYAQLKAALDRGRAAAADRLKQLSVMSGAAMQVCNAAQLRA